MGKLTITGSSQREVIYDAIDLTITFNGRAKKTSDAVNTVMQQCEQLLRLLSDVGVNTKDIHIGENSVDRNYNDSLINVNNGVTVNASREITLRLKFDMPFINGLMDMIHKQDFSVDFDCQYVLTTQAELHAELLKEAVADSQKKAAAIAEVTGQSIIGIDSMGYNSYFDDDFKRMDYMECAFRLASPEPRLSDQLQAPISTERETVSVVWLIE